MKVIRIINSLDFGGIERVYEITAKYFKGNKTDLIFICLGNGGSASRYIESLGYNVIIINAKTRIPNLKLIIQVYRLLKRESPDVVHACGAEGNFHGLIAAWLANIPVRIGEEIGKPSHSSLAKKIFRLVYGSATGIIAVARSVQEYLLNNNEVESGKLSIIYNPVDIQKFLQPRKPQLDNFIILTVCRLHPIKNLYSLINVFNRLVIKHSDCRLWLVGDGPARKDLENQVEEKGIKDLVKFWGFHDDPAHFYSQANAFVLPSFSEGHPVSMIEAMVAGVPVIATLIGGAPEIIEDGVRGWLIDPKNESDIYDKLENLLELSISEKDKITDEARRYVLQYFSPEKYLSQLEIYYKSLLK